MIVNAPLMDLPGLTALARGHDLSRRIRSRPPLDVDGKSAVGLKFRDQVTTVGFAKYAWEAAAAAEATYDALMRMKWNDVPRA
jgi:hypothetical protein